MNHLFVLRAAVDKSIFTSTPMYRLIWFISDYQEFSAVVSAGVRTKKQFQAIPINIHALTSLAKQKKKKE